MAALVHKDQEFLLAVFAKAPHGTYALHSQTKWQQYHERWHGASLEFRHESLYFTVTGSGGCCEDYREQVQLKLQRGEFQRIGQESTISGFKPANDERGISFQYGTSINYLNGSIKHWRVQAPSSSDPGKYDILEIKSGKRRMENFFRFAPQPLQKLSDYDYWRESEVRPRHAGGYIDEEFKYKE
jgi:hypothetical protein